MANTEVKVKKLYDCTKEANYLDYKHLCEVRHKESDNVALERRKYEINCKIKHFRDTAISLTTELIVLILSVFVSIVLFYMSLASSIVNTIVEIKAGTPEFIKLNAEERDETLQMLMETAIKTTLSFTNKLIYIIFFAPYIVFLVLITYRIFKDKKTFKQKSMLELELQVINKFIKYKEIKTKVLIRRIHIITQP